MNTLLSPQFRNLWLLALALALTGCSPAREQPEAPPTAELHDAGLADGPEDEIESSTSETGRVEADPAAAPRGRALDTGDSETGRAPASRSPDEPPAGAASRGGSSPAASLQSNRGTAGGLTDPRPLQAPEEPAPQPAEPNDGRSPAEIAATNAFAAPEGARRLSPDARLWVDPHRGRLIVDGYVTLREGPLEMFACPVGTKEHESIVSVLAQARYVHAALLAIGAMPGTPVSFSPEYRPATGQRIAIWVLWRDAEGRVRKLPAQQWIRHTGTDEPLETDWVFAGSSFWTDPASGKEYYQADSGDLVCVSNFSTAMLDLPVESTQSNAALQYSAFTEKIPPRGTPVRLVFVPIPLPVDDPGPAAEGRVDPQTPPEDTLLKPASETDQAGQQEPAAEADGT